jgi:hypothetical protein
MTTDTRDDTRDKSREVVIDGSPAAHAIERLRLAEARLARRRQTACGPSETARAAMRFVWERSDDGAKITPTDIAEHLGISTASVTSILQSLKRGGLIGYVPNPDDGRSKYVVPYDRDIDPDDIDPLGASIRAFAQELTPSEAERIAAFLDAVTAAVDLDCT